MNAKEDAAPQMTNEAVEALAKAKGDPVPVPVEAPKNDTSAENSTVSSPSVPPAAPVVPVVDPKVKEEKMPSGNVVRTF